jgi:hypothetical protein
VPTFVAKSYRSFGNEAVESARSLRPDFCEHRLRNAEAGLLKRSDGHVEVDQAGLFGFVENGKRAGNPQAPASRFLSARLLIHEHDVGMHLRRKRDRLALAQVKLPQNQAALWTQDLDPRRRVNGPVLDRFRRKLDASAPPARHVEPKFARIAA